MSSIQRQNALAFITYVDARNYNALGELISDCFTHRFHPGSLDGLGMPVRSKQQFIDHVKELEPLLESFNFQPPLEIIEAQDVVVLHVVSDGKTASGKPYNNEYIFTFRFDGEKISSIKEFMDSRYVSQMAEGEGTSTSGFWECK